MASQILPELGGMDVGGDREYWGRNPFRPNSETSGSMLLFLELADIAFPRTRWTWFGTVSRPVQRGRNAEQPCSASSTCVDSREPDQLHGTGLVALADQQMAPIARRQVLDRSPWKDTGLSTRGNDAEPGGGKSFG